jgi:hypothetical protein
MTLDSITENCCFVLYQHLNYEREEIKLGILVAVPPNLCVGCYFARNESCHVTAKFPPVSFKIRSRGYSVSSV